MSSTRSRPYPMMISPDEALVMVTENVSRLAPRDVPLSAASGLQLAEDVVADRDYPPFDRAMMDGYAVRTADSGKTIPIIGQIAAGVHATAELEGGQCLEIMTGAVCPPGTQAVVPKERVRRSGDEASLPRKIIAGEHIAPKGSESPTGRTVLRVNQTITPLAVAVMASVGKNLVRVTPRPRLGVITTGAELTAPGRDPGPAEIRDSNGAMLVAMTVEMGLDEPPHLHAQDSTQAILDTLNTLSARDMILVTGGVSVGSFDLVPDAVSRYGAEVVFHKVSQKPGKPLLVARRGDQILFGLPGNPLSAHFCFHRYVAAAIRKMKGKSPAVTPAVGRLAATIQPKDGRTYFVTARAERVGDAGTWRVHPMPGLSSADMFASAQANCYVEVPSGRTELLPGEEVAFTWIGMLRGQTKPITKTSPSCR